MGNRPRAHHPTVAEASIVKAHKIEIVYNNFFSDATGRELLRTAVPGGWLYSHVIYHDGGAITHQDTFVADNEGGAGAPSD